MSRLLVIQLKRIGDFILTAPAVQALREAMHDAEIVMLVPSNVADLAGCLPAVSRVIPYARGRMNLETWASAIAGEWSACLDFTGNDRSAIIAQLSRARKRVGYSKFARGLRKLAYTATSHASVRDLHTVDFHLALVETLLGGPAPAPARTAFHFPVEVASTATTLMAQSRVQPPYAVIHPGTAREEKFWLADRWAQVAAHLHEVHGLHPVLTGSGDGLESPHLDSLRSKMIVPFSDLTGRLTLPQLAMVISGSRVIAGVDSMAMHLASLFETPQVALFGPTNPYHWRSRHAGSRVVMPWQNAPVARFVPKMKKGLMQDIPPCRVTAALDELLIG